MDQSPPLHEFEMAPALAPPPAPPPAQGPTLPAALRVFLYLVCWFVLAQIIAAPLVIAYIAVLVSQGQLDFQALLQNPTAGQAILERKMLELPGLIISAISAFGAAIAITPIFTAFIDRRPFRSIGFELIPRWWVHCVTGFFLDASHMTVLFAIGIAAGWYQITYVTPFPQSLGIFLIAFAIALPAAAAEEITMRGYTQGVLAQRYGVVPAVLVNSLLFALMHLGNPGSHHPMVIAGLLIAGVYFSVAYAATGQLWLPIVGHATWNVFEGPFYGLPVSGLPNAGTIFHVTTHGPALWTGGRFGPEAGIPVILTTLLWTFVVWRVGRALTNPTRPSGEEVPTLSQPP